MKNSPDYLDQLVFTFCLTITLLIFSRFMITKYLQPHYNPQPYSTQESYSTQDKWLFAENKTNFSANFAYFYLLNLAEVK